MSENGDKSQALFARVICLFYLSVFAFFRFSFVFVSFVLFHLRQKKKKREIWYQCVHTRITHKNRTNEIEFAINCMGFS